MTVSQPCYNVRITFAGNTLDYRDLVTVTDDVFVVAFRIVEVDEKVVGKDD